MPIEVSDKKLNTYDINELINGVSDINITVNGDITIDYVNSLVKLLCILMIFYMIKH